VDTILADGAGSFKVTWPDAYAKSANYWKEPCESRWLVIDCGPEGGCFQSHQL